ncbi:gastric triacylglycerol lipase-like [Diadema antillarum]|uniref:gastric triacylglycerol lipase-like n=1 Tax=Diadema antillarum TaxID=105358 RepID=UPI003A853BC4
MIDQWRDSHPSVMAALSPPLSTSRIDPDDRYNMSGLVWSKGYPIEEYEVQTEDGYILGLFRIPHGKNKGNDTGARPVVFLQHGLLAASTNWVENPANESLGFILADLGYDVWMGNMRGNTYSKKHVSLSPRQKEFWEFSWDQMAKYDLPAMIDFALSKSGQSRLAYVGHSQGTLIAFTGFTINPELGRKVTTLIALGPVYTVAHINIGLRDLIYAGVIELLVDELILLGLYEFLPQNFISNDLAARTICAFPATEFLCADFLMMLAGFSEHHLNKSRIQVYVSNEPAGTSLQNMKHFIQMVVSGKCQMYDYGRKQNRIRYNSTTPPEYHVEDLKVPVALFWGDDDFLADPKDVANLIPRIRKLIFNKEIKNFEHLDFIWAMDAKSVLYDDVIRLIRGSMAAGL